MENNTLRLIPEMDMGELEKLIYDSQKVKAELDLLKRVIIRSLALDYSGKELMLSSDKLIIETMRVIEPAILADILESEMDAEADRKAKELEEKLRPRRAWMRLRSQERLRATQGSMLSMLSSSWMIPMMLTPRNIRARRRRASQHRLRQQHRHQLTGI